ncbi:hypothetical protein N9C66_08075 [Akkermansiaceae bacterium]|nr:hypothetical protein [bacterium]MDA9831285.1 hypothetical protein [Akkermansiaceae bacterium]MDB4422854.1 hypothetical protein [bacterium]
MNDFLVNIISESESLRRLNLAATPRWREWLRRKLPNTDVGAGKVYDVDAVDALVRKMAGFAKDTEFVEELKNVPAPTSRELDKMSKLSDRRGPSA